MTPELPAYPTFINTNTTAVLEHMLDALAGELSGAARLPRPASLPAPR